MPPQKIGRYEIKGELGRGGMATVYHGHDPRFKRDVAIKVLPAQFLSEATFRARFEREAQAIAALEHPAIVPVYDFGDEEGQPYLVMRYMPGGSLADRLSHGPLSPQEISHIIARLASALDQVHAHGIVHRDLKPANILFDQYGEAYLSDFGIAHLSEATTSLTGDAIVGTPAYMSPEQARGDPIDRRSDLYALGVILFQMLSGRQPYEASTPIAVAMKHITDPIPSLRAVRPDLPPTFDRVIASAMAKEPDKRFSTGNDLFTAFQRAMLGAAGAEPRAVGAPPPAPKVPAAAPSQHPVARPPTPAPMRPPVAARAVPPPQRTGFPWWVWLLGGLALFGIVGTVAVLGVGFLLSSLSRVNPTPEPTAETLEKVDFPTEEPLFAAPPPLFETPETPILSLPFQDDFSDVNSGWPSYSGDEGFTGYDADGYVMYADLADTFLVAVLGMDVSLVELNVEATKVGGPDDNFFGLVCHYQDDENYYFLAISSDGYYAIGKLYEGEYHLFDGDTSDAIHQGNTSNVLRAECGADYLALAVNGIPVSEVSDDTFPWGDVGLVVGAHSTAGVKILFDDFQALAP